MSDALKKLSGMFADSDRQIEEEQKEKLHKHDAQFSDSSDSICGTRAQREQIDLHDEVEEQKVAISDIP